MSFSWVDPHYASLYERREEIRATERLAAKLRERAELEAYVPPEPVRQRTWFEQENEIRSRVRLI